MRILFAVACFGFAGCEAPDVAEQVPRTGIITGELIYRGPPPTAAPDDGCPDQGSARGNVVISLIDAEAEGLASGLTNLVVVPSARLFGDAVSDGIFTADYTIPTVAPGRYEVLAFVDFDGDFNPGLPILSQPTAGDVLGAHVDANTLERLQVRVDVDDSIEQVTVQLAQPVPVEPPVFSMTSTLRFNLNSGVARLRLDAQSVMRSALCLDAQRTSFLVQYRDEDGNGMPEDADNDGLLDVFPRVTLRQLDAPSNESVIVTTAIDPAPYTEQLNAGMPVLTSSVEAAIRPVAVAISPDGSQRTLPGLPSGLFEVSVELGTGQAWRVPNELDLVQPERSPSDCPAEIGVCSMSSNGCPCRCPAPTEGTTCADATLPAQCRCVALNL
ncbi:MAG: hypothetical protein AAFV29_06025 [Myxococcota bacterium]